MEDVPEEKRANLHIRREDIKDGDRSDGGTAKHETKSQRECETVSRLACHNNGATKTRVEIRAVTLGLWMPSSYSEIEGS